MRKIRFDMVTKFEICQKVFYFNTVTRKVEPAEVKGIQVMPTGISKNEKGENVLDGSMVLYQTVEGPTLAETEVYGSREEAVAGLKEIVEALG